MIFKIEETLEENSPKILFFIAPKNDSQWVVKNIQEKGFTSRKDLISEEKAKDVLNDVVFIHKAKFIGICESKESCIQLAIMSLDN